MASNPRIAALSGKLEGLLQAEKLEAARAVYDELELADPKEPRWPHRKGDLELRRKRPAEAITAYERAVDLYVRQGFAARGAALAKVILGLDKTRHDVLERIDGRAMRDARDAKSRVPVRVDARDASTDVGDSLVEEVIADASAGERRSLVFDAPMMMPDESAPNDETRFVDMTKGDVIEVDVDDLEVASEDEVLFVDDMPTLDALVEMPSVPLFADVPQETLTRMLELAELVDLADGAPLVRIGEDADSLFVLAEGNAEVRVPGGHPIILTEGEIVGETCLFPGMKRKADVVAKGPLRALELRRESLDALIAMSPALGGILYDLLTRRLVQNLLRRSEIFATFDPAFRNEVGQLFEVRRISADTTLAAEGKRADGMYVPLLGKLEARLPDGRVAVVPTGTMLCEQSLFARTPMRSTLTSRTELILLRLSTSKFMELASVYPAVLERLAELAARGSFEDRLAGTVPSTV